MIVFDTNLISEPFRPNPDSRVIAWIAAHPDAAISAVSVGELLRGVVKLPLGRRREELAASIEGTLAAHVGKVLPYDEDAARAYARIHERRRLLGRPLAIEDGMIAASALIRGASVATRNVKDFADLGVEIVNPWE